MTITERVSLIRAGYSKAEINEMIEQEKTPAQTPEQPVQTPAQTPEQPVQTPEQTPEQPVDTKAILSAITALTETLQATNLKNTKMPTSSEEESAQSVLQNIINPTLGKGNK